MATRSKIRRATQVKERMVLKGVIAGKSVTQAAIDAGYSQPSAVSAGSRALRHVKDSMPESLKRAGLGLDQMTNEIKRGLAKGDLGRHDSYLKLALQCHGVLDEQNGGGQVINLGMFMLKGMRERGLEHLLDDDAS